MNGITSSIFRKQPMDRPLSLPAKRQPAFDQQPSLLIQGPARDQIHFEGRNRKKPDQTKTPVTSSDEDTDWNGSEGSSSDSDTGSASPTTTRESSPEQDPKRHRYPLRKRPKTDNHPTEASDSEVNPLERQFAHRNTRGVNRANGQDDKTPGGSDALGMLLLALLSNGAMVTNEESDSDSDSDEDEKKSEFNVISHKKSPFGPNAEKLGFQRIAGMEPLKSDLNRLLVDQLKNPQLYKDYGLENSSSGVLLYGPPGNGKTYFAKALAEEAGANFLEIHPSTIASPFIHQTSKLIGGAFNAAAEAAKKSKKPTVLLIDEVDAVAPQRGGEVTSNHNNEEVAEFLNQLNECATKNVFVVATTNLPEKLDPALIRSGRMNSKIYVGAPDDKSREQVIKHYLGKRSADVVDEKLDTSDIASETKGFSIADLQELVNQAARHALEKREKITKDAFRQALKKVHPSISESTEEQYKQAIGKFETKSSSDDWKRMYF